MSAPIPLSREDRDILALESATVAGHTCKVVVLGEGAPPLEELRAVVAARLPAMLHLAAGRHRRAAGVGGGRGLRHRATTWARGRGSRPAARGGGASCSSSASTARGRCGGWTWSRSTEAARRWCGGSTTRWPTARPACGWPTRCCGTRRRPAPARARAGRHERRRAHLAGFVRREFVPERGAARPSTGRSARGAGSPSPPCRCTALHDAAKAPRRRHVERRGAVGRPRARCAAGPRPTTAAWRRCGRGCR